MGWSTVWTRGVVQSGHVSVTAKPRRSASAARVASRTRRRTSCRSTASPVALDRVIEARTIVRRAERRPIKEKAMTAPTDELTRIARESQEAVTAALSSWTEAAERYATNFDAKKPLPSAADA